MSRTVHYVSSGDLTPLEKLLQRDWGVFGMDSAGREERRWSALMDWTLVCQTAKTSALDVVEAHSKLALQLMFICSVKRLEK